jgi:beta-galactosidase
MQTVYAVNLATPTASPPAWMIKLHPDMLPVTVDGTTLWHGSRRHYCPHNPNYHRYARRIARTLAEQYKNHPGLAMWHVDNEYGCHVGECYCPHSVSAFRGWLKQRYATLDRLNFAWGTAFWSQTYSDWDEIQPPRQTPTLKNPTQQLDWARFSSDSWLACFEEQKEILKKITPEIPVTTNFMSFHKPIDYFKFALFEDVVAIDSYPDTQQADWMVQSGMTFDLIRSLKKDTPWILMEQAPSQVNWRQRNTIKRPGIMRLGSLQAVARGANGVLFFQWRQSKAGVEKFHSGMLPHAGTESRVWREVNHLGNELPRFSNLLDSKVTAKVAILMDWQNWWSLGLESKPSNDLTLIANIQALYRRLFERNISIDFVPPEGDLNQL